MELLDNPVHRDAWGSPTAIPRLLGRAPDGEPQSELWMGAHPSSPSRIAHAAQTLNDVIAADPVRALGDAVVDIYGPRLPFLLKVLAADSPLSLQAHPTKAQAAAGYAEEARLGITSDNPTRNYADDNHKPEMLCALTDFHALCGFRPVQESVRLLESLEIDALAVDIATLRADPDSTGVRTVLTRILHLPAAERGPLVAAVAGRCADLVAGGGADAQLLQTVVELATRHPTDAGVVCALLMNRVTLQPGEAIFLSAGNLHAYLRGVGIELMASSDNVLRGGLTARHVDVEELLAILDTNPEPVSLVTPLVDNDVQTSYPVPVQDFALSRLTLRGDRSYELQSGRPQILLVVEGTLEVAHAGTDHELRRGQAAFLAAGDPPAELSGTATAFLASTPRPAPVSAPTAGTAG